jgi:hypothetical protein
MPSAYLRLRRISQWMSRFRKFGVMLDGECIDKISNGTARVYEISPGEHELVVSIDWVSSGPVVFNCPAEHEVRFVCGHPTPSWRAAFLPHTLISTIDLVPDDAPPLEEG